MDKIKIVKTSLNIAASIGAGGIVYGIVRSNVAPANIIGRICLPVGTFAVGGVVARAASDEMDRIVDDVVKAFSDKPVVETPVTE